MKTPITFLFLFFICVHVAYGQIFVDADAAGNNNGTSWADAYSDLQDALDDAGNTAIWIADGTYKPGNGTPDTAATFLINREVAIYGGFAGTESALEDRNITSNETIISGDILGNDMAGVFDTMKTDNARSVFRVDTIGAPVIFDGLTIMGGHTSDNSDLPLSDWRGGGIYALNAIHVRNCTFRENFALNGAAVSVLGFNASGSTFENCVLTGNHSTSRCAGIYLNRVDSVLVRNCDFTDNPTSRGMVYFFRGIDSRVEDCTFTGNSSPVNLCAALYNWNSPNLQIKNCTFNGNSADRAGVFYLDGRELVDEVLIEVDSSTFSGNSTTGISAGFLAFNCHVILRNSEISRNTSSSSAAFRAADGSRVQLYDCLISGNTAPWAAGGATYGGISEYYNCTIASNTAENGGGGGSCGFMGSATFNDCLFEKNSASFGGGYFMQNDSSSVVFNNCEFSENSANDADNGIGGGFYTNAGTSTRISDCVFSSNSAESFGGGLSIGEDSLNISNALIERTEFVLNSAGEQGGAVNISNSDVDMINCLFNSNGASGSSPAGRGGAISNNASLGGESSASTVRVINSTFVNNLGDYASTIIQWEENDNADFPDSTGTASIILQNNIFYDFGTAYAIEAGEPEVISQGGNLTFNSDAFNTYLTKATDLLNVDPLFVNDGSDQNNPEDYRLRAGSPAIDAGVADGAPTDDITGMLRDALPNIGAYEGFTVGNREIIDNHVLSLAPNPAVDFIQLSLDNDWNGQVEVIVHDQMGRNLFIRQLQKSNGLFQQNFAVGSLPPGVYQLSVVHRDQMVVRSFVKQ